MHCIKCDKEISSIETWTVELIIYNSDLEPWGNELHQDLLCPECAKKAKIDFEE